MLGRGGEKEVKGERKTVILLAFALVIGVVLVVSGSGLLGGIGSKEKEDKVDNICFEQKTEERLKTLISSLYGIDGEVKIMLTTEGESTNGKNPDIKGVAVVCNAPDATRAEIIKLLSALLSISTTHIFVGTGGIS